MTSYLRAHDVICAKNLRTPIDVIPHTTVHIYIKPHNCLNYNGMPQIMRKRSIIINMQFKQRKIFKILWSESRVYKNWQTWAIIREISYSNLNTGRYGQNMEFSRIIQESSQRCSSVTLGLWLFVFGQQDNLLCLLIQFMSLCMCQNLYYSVTDQLLCHL